jgi:hypothetical protein
MRTEDCDSLQQTDRRHEWKAERQPSAVYDCRRLVKRAISKHHESQQHIIQRSINTL